MQYNFTRLNIYIYIYLHFYNCTFSPHSSITVSNIKLQRRESYLGLKMLGITGTSFIVDRARKGTVAKIRTR